VALLFGKKVLAVGDQEAQIASAGLIDAREVNFVKNAMA